MTAMAFRRFDDMTKQGVEVLVQGWSGNVRPWCAIVFVDGVRKVSGGFCASPERAAKAALAKWEATVGK